MKTNHNQINVNAAFKSALKNVRANGGKLTQEKSATIALATVGALFNDDGAPIVLTSPQKDALKAMFYPQVKLRMSVIKATLAAADCTLDGATEVLLAGLLTPAQLEKKLDAARNVAPVINWSEMVDEEESASSDEQNEPGNDDDDPEEGEAGEEPDEEPPAAETKPLNPKKPAGK